MPSIFLNSLPVLSILDSNSRSSLGRRKTSVVMAAGRSEAADLNSSESMVGENMIVLRKRIYEMKMIEKNYEPPTDWMDWEKRYHTSYDSMICDELGVLQTQLMNRGQAWPLVWYDCLACIECAYFIGFSLVPFGGNV